MDQYTIANLNNDLINDYTQSFVDNGIHKEKEVVEWQFFKNRVDTKLVDIAFSKDSGEIAGTYAVSNINFKVGDQIFTCAQSLDTMTDKKHRGKGLFVKLAKQVYQRAKNEGVAFIYGFPNGSSIHGFVNKLQWKTHDPVPFLIKPINTRYFTKRIKYLRVLPNIKLARKSFRNNTSFSIVEHHALDEGTDALWTKFSETFKVGIVRDKAYLEWRYISKPMEAYRIAHLYDESNYLGFIIFTVKKKHEGKIGYIMEHVFDPSHPKAGQILMDYAVDNLVKDNADCILSWCFKHSMNYKFYRKAGFVTLPNRFRPIELHFGYHTLIENLDSILNEKSNWFISYSDSDTV